MPGAVSAIASPSSWRAPTSNSKASFQTSSASRAGVCSMRSSAARRRRRRWPNWPKRCFIIFPFESGELLICGPLQHYLKLLAASAQARNFFDLYAVIVIDGPGAHVRVSVVNRGVDRGAACDVARPSSLCAPDHPFADVFSDLGHRDKRATIVGHANGVPGLKPPRRRILRMDADGWRACSLQLRRDVRKDGIDEVIPVSALTESTGNHSIIETLVGEFARQPFGQP